MVLPGLIPPAVFRMGRKTVRTTVSDAMKAFIDLKPVGWWIPSGSRPDHTPAPWCWEARTAAHSHSPFSVGRPWSTTATSKLYMFVSNVYMCLIQRCQVTKYLYFVTLLK
ncbi:hypothetical protein PFLUV_G00276690 [Perca fluviatilis]|uniref:Uncharacterized protein n=1 Tax=Perca fluviatilis TaxID=8168 RepID=A0A6A5E1W5_PERFL|nr:hypothetical protein PFLUV_G00276690 [Perca fluviatilis]